MPSVNTPAIPIKLEQARVRLERWRRTRRHRARIPEPLWSAAGELAREHGVFPTAKALRLQYGKLKRLAESASPGAKPRVLKATPARPRRAPSTAPPTFLELMPSSAMGRSECVIELEGRRGKMRIPWKGTTVPDLGGLSRALWESK
jgi:hypothetical protein